MGGDEHAPRIMTQNKKSARLRSGLFRRFGQRLAAILNILRDAFQTPAGGFRPGGYFFDIGEGVGIVGFLSKLFKERMDLGENVEHFSATARLHTEFIVASAGLYDRRSLTPITS